MLMSAMKGSIVTPPIVKVSPKGITAHTRNDGMKISAGASMNTNFSALAGVRSSLAKSLRTSAMGWSTPRGPTRLGPIRTCM